MYPEVFLQNAACRHALRELGRGDPAEETIGRLPKVKTEPNFEPVRGFPEGSCFEKFLSAMQLWTCTGETCSSAVTKLRCARTKKGAGTEMHPEIRRHVISRSVRRDVMPR